jgi:hypothetical protein
MSTWLTELAGIGSPKRRKHDGCGVPQAATLRESAQKSSPAAAISRSCPVSVETCVLESHAVSSTALSIRHRLPWSGCV